MRGTSFIIVCLALGSFLFLMPGCSNDAKKGCTDPKAESYDPAAEENDASACTYARDKFIGQYEGDLSCLEVLATIINGMTTFSIDESSKGSEFVDITIQSNPVLRLEATVSGNTLTVDTYIPGVTIAISGIPLLVDITAKGVLTIENNDKMISGQLAIDLNLSGSIISDKCNISGTKI